MRLSRDRIRARIKSDLPLTFGSERISAYGGLELMRRFVGVLDLRRRLDATLRGVGVGGDYGAAQICLAIMGLLLVGGWRVTHLAFVGTDPLLLRFCGLRQLPADRTIVRMLKSFSSSALCALQDLVRDLVHDSIAREKLARVTLDLDGTVLRTGAHVGGAARGYNPHHPKDPSYYPLTAHVAQLGQILRVLNRPGNVHDSNGADGFLRVVVRELRARFGCAQKLELRMDGAFFVPKVLAFLDEERVEYAVKVPLWKWLGLRERIRAKHVWRRVSSEVEGFETWLYLAKWQRSERICVYRKRVSHETRKNFQLDLFSPDDGHFEYSAIATNKTLDVAALWHFAAGRGGHEKTLGELKQNFAFGAIPTNDALANAVWQQLSVLTLNLVRGFETLLGAPRRSRSLKRTFHYAYRSLQTLRFQWIAQPARIARPAGRVELRFAVSPRARKTIEDIDDKLRRLRVAA